MPVILCSNGKYKIGQNGKCVYVTKAKAEAAYKGYLATKREEEKTMQEAPSLNKKELRAMLDAQIRREAGYRMRDNYSSLGVLAIDDESTTSAVNDVYDGIVSSFAHNENTVKATRAVRFTKSYVRRIIKAGLKDGSIKTEAMTAKMDVAVSEAMPAFLKKIIDKKKGKDGDKDDKKKKDGKKGKFPFNLKKKAKK